MKIISTIKQKIVITLCINCIVMSFSCSSTKNLRNKDLINEKEDLLISQGTIFSKATIVGRAGKLLEQSQEEERKKRLENWAEKLRNKKGVNFYAFGDTAFKATILNEILFKFDSYSINDTAKQYLYELNTILKEMPQARIAIRGHTDNIGTEDYNNILSLNRSLAVGNFLRSNGLNYQSIQEYGAGDSEPIADNNTPHGRRLNRRVEITIKEL